MFPFVRLGLEMLRVRRLPPMHPMQDEHVSHHICMPWDIDMFLELNNGRALTLFDIGRLGMGVRAGLTAALRREGWGLTMAGSSVRYRRRVLMFDRVMVRTRPLGVDARFMYIEQSMWKSNGECAHHALYRAAATDRNGIVTPDRIMAAMGIEDPPPPLPEWVTNWCEAEATRPWPPMQPGT